MVKESTTNFRTAMVVLECHWGYQLREGVFDKTQWGYGICGILDRVLEN